MKTPAAIVVSLAVLATLCLGAATAGEWRTSELVLRDGAGDVWTTPIGGDSYTPAPEDRAGRHHLWQQSGDAVPCAAMSHRIDYSSETVAVQIPRRCLGTPGWVRVVVNNIHETTSRLAEDNPHSDQPFPHEPTRRLFAR